MQNIIFRYLQCYSWYNHTCTALSRLFRLVTLRSKAWGLFSLFSFSFFLSLNPSSPRLPCLLCLKAKWTGLNGCFRMCCPRCRSVRKLLLVTDSLSVSSYLTLQRHSYIAKPPSRDQRRELAPGLRQILCLLWIPVGFQQGRNLVTWSLFLHLFRIFAQAWPDFDEMAFVVVGVCFSRLLSRLVWEDLDLDLELFTLQEVFPAMAD